MQTAQTIQFCSGALTLPELESEARLLKLDNYLIPRSTPLQVHPNDRTLRMLIWYWRFILGHTAQTPGIPPLF